MVGPTGRVIAIEPDPEIFQRLEANIEENHLSHVSAVQCAVADREGQMLLHRDMSGNTGANSLSSSNTRDTMGIQVQVRTLDNILTDSGIERLDAIKIDVEGWEVHVLKESRVLHQEPRPLVLAEAVDHLLRAAGSSLQELEELFIQRGFVANSLGTRDRFFVGKPQTDL